MINKNLYLAIGQLAMAVSILLNRFAEDTAPVSFIIGLLTGMSIVLHFAFSFSVRREKSNPDLQ